MSDERSAYRPTFEQKAPTHRYKTLLAPPDAHELHQQLLIARERIDTAVELCWPDKSDLKKNYVLSCFVANDQKVQLPGRDAVPKSQPQWNLALESLSGRTNMWKYGTADMETLVNMIATQVDGGGVKQGRITSEVESVPASVSIDVAAKSNFAVSFQGDLNNVSLSSVLQSLNLCAVTGRLDVYSVGIKGEVFFQNGLVNHAVRSSGGDFAAGSQMVGEQVVVELLTWQVGSFLFHPDRVDQGRSIARRLESILMQGAALADHCEALNKLGFDLDKTMCQYKEFTSRDELMELVLNVGLDTHLEEQEAVFQALAKPVRIGNIIDSLKLPLNKYVPIMFSLMSSGAIGLRDKQVQQEDQLDPMPVDAEAAYWAFRSLLAQNVEMMPFPLFAYFLQTEFLRYERTGRSFCVAIGETTMVDPPDMFWKQVVSKLEPVKNDIDLMTKLSNQTFAVLFSSSSALESCECLFDWVAELSRHQIKMAFGLAEAPAGGKEPGIILAAAKKALELAISEGKSVCVYRDFEIELWCQITKAAEAAYHSARYDEAEAKINQALALAKNFSVADAHIRRTLQLQASIFIKQKRPELAEPTLQSIVNALKSGVVTGAYADAVEAFAKCLCSQGKYSEAANELAELVDAYESAGNMDLRLPYVLNNLAAIQMIDNQLQVGEPTYRRALDAAKSKLGSEHPDTIKMQKNLARVISRRLSEVQGRSTTTPTDLEELWMSVT